MNHIKLAHFGGDYYRLGGKGRLYINGHEVRGVLNFVPPDLMSTDSIVSVTITLAVSEFVYGPEAAPAVTMRD